MANENQTSLLLDIKVKLEDLNKAVQGLKQVGQVGEESANRASKAQENQLDTIKQLEKELEELKQVLKKASDAKPIEELTKATQEAAESIEELGEKGGDSQSKLAKIASLAADLTITATGAKDLVLQIKDLTVALFESVKAVADEDNRLNNLSKTLGLTKDVIKAVENEFIAIGDSIEGAQGALTGFGTFLAEGLADPASV